MLLKVAKILIQCVCIREDVYVHNAKPVHDDQCDRTLGIIYSLI